MSKNKPRATMTEVLAPDWWPAKMPSDLLAQQQNDTADARTVDRATPCRLCGGPVAAEGARYVGGWRQHPECQAVPQAVASVLLGEVVTAEDVRDPSNPHGIIWVPAYFRSGIGNSATSEPVKPWSWVSAAEREEVRAAVDTNRLGSLSLPNTDGRGCAWCGVRESIEWWETSFTFRDGGRANLCGTCWEPYADAGQPYTWEEDSWRRRVLRLAVGAKTTPVDHLGIKTYAETAHAPYAGTLAPWQYIPTATIQEAQVQTFGDRPRDALDPEAGRAAALVWRARYLRERRERQTVKDDGITWG